MKPKHINTLFGTELKIINMGLASFADNLKEQKVKTVKMEWRPPAGGNEKMIALLKKLEVVSKPSFGPKIKAGGRFKPEE